LGSAGVWICGEDGAQTDCQANEFFMTGTSNVNIPEGETPAGIAYDFRPPVAPLTSFEISAGDGAVVIKWDLETPGDINGFRVLCADENGAPLSSKGVSAPSLTAENNGTIYYTANNMCPDGAFFDVNGNKLDTDSGGTGGGTTTGGTTASPGTSATSSASTSTSTGGDTSTGGATSGTTTAGVDPEIDEVFENLSYEYVCSAHLGSATSNVRIEGLENGRRYQFIVVAYDQFGNPVVATPTILEGEPEATDDLWDTCQKDEFAGVCGERGFCNCSVGEDMGRELLFSALGLGLFGLARRRRRS
jgi:MYXO-CTERM domain-containing protein